MIVDKKMSAATVENIHTLLHPTFELAIKDGYIRTNPTEGIVKEIKKGSLSSKNKRVTLTEKQTKAFFGFLKDHTGFVFTSRMGSVFVPNVINKAIGRIIDAYNTAEIEKALKANRSAELLPHFSCHSLRHTICARLCEVEDNVKFIQEFMGHADITTTMDIYAEFSAEKKQEKVTTLSKKINME